MTGHADVSPHLSNHAFGVDQEGRPDDAHESVSVELLLLPHAKGVADRPVFIGTEPYLEEIRVFKAGVCLNTLAWNNKIGPYALINSVKYYQKLYDESKIVDNRILRTILCFLMAMLYAIVALSGVDPMMGFDDVENR